MTPSVDMAMGWNERSLIESIVSSFFILDYGFISKVNPDKTINVTHAKRLKTYTDETLPEMTTENVEVLTLSGKGFSLNFDYAKGDKVLLLGLKNMVDKVSEVSQATEMTNFLHYSRETLKAIPLCVFSDEAKVKIEIEEGNLKVKTNGNIELNGKDKQFVTWQELDDALQDVWTAVQNHVHPTTQAGSPTGPSTTLASKMLDISGAKTTTVVTGG